MEKTILLDTNMLIGALDGQPGNSQHSQAKQQLQALLKDPQTTLAISPLIRYEVLRFPNSPERIQALKDALNGFIEFEINAAVGNLAAEIFRNFEPAMRKEEKRKFDIFHFATAKIYGLSLDTQDTGFPAIQKIYEKLSPHA